MSTSVPDARPLLWAAPRGALRVRFLLPTWAATVGGKLLLHDLLRASWVAILSAAVAAAVLLSLWTAAGEARGRRGAFSYPLGEHSGDTVRALGVFLLGAGAWAGIVLVTLLAAACGALLGFLGWVADVWVALLSIAGGALLVLGVPVTIFLVPASVERDCDSFVATSAALSLVRAFPLRIVSGGLVLGLSTLLGAVFLGLVLAVGRLLWSGLDSIARGTWPDPSALLAGLCREVTDLETPSAVLLGLVLAFVWTSGVVGVTRLYAELTKEL